MFSWSQEMFCGRGVFCRIVQIWSFWGYKSALNCMRNQGNRAYTLIFGQNMYASLTCTGEPTEHIFSIFSKFRRQFCMKFRGVARRQLFELRSKFHLKQFSIFRKNRKSVIEFLALPNTNYFRHLLYY